MSELNPLLSADRQHELLRKALLETFPERLRQGVRNLMQSGNLLGTVPTRSRFDAYMQLRMRHEGYVQVALDPNAMPGDKFRAQQALQQEEELRQEILGP